MRRWLLILPVLAALTVQARAAEVPEDLVGALPEEVEPLLEAVEYGEPEGFSQGLGRIWDHLRSKAGEVLRERVRDAAAILLVVTLCGAVESLGAKPYVTMAGALSVTALTAGSSLIGLGAETVGQLSTFSKALLPTLAAATAASGAVTTAAVQQVTTVFCVDLLMNLIDGLLMPLVYLYIGALTAAGCLTDGRLGAIAQGLKKAVVWTLSTALLAFTVYLSVVRVVSGTVDGTTVKVAKTAISGVVPVVGGIIAEASETVLLGAGMLRGTVGVFGMLGILAACAYPFLQLGVQYLLYKTSAFLAGALGAPGLCKLIDGLGGAFGLVLGMTGSCALLLFISILSAMSAVLP